MHLLAERDLALQLAERAGAIALEIYQRPFTAEEKADKSPVTEADRRINAFLVAAIQQAFPDDLVIGEESAAATSLDAPRVWFVDPIDGTSDFVKKNGEWSVMIGLAIDGSAALGVVAEPTRDRVLWAVAGQGAWLRDADSERQLRVRDDAEPETATVVNSRSHPDARIERVVERLRVANTYAHGSVGCKLAHIAEGRADMYFNFSGKCSMWDTCGPEVIIREAGGDLVGFDGAPIRYAGHSTDVPQPFVATTDVWKARVLEVTGAMADELDPSRHP